MSATSIPPSVDVLLLIISPDEISDDRLNAEVRRLEQFRRSGMSWPLRILCAPSDQGEMLLREHNPRVVHVRNISPGAELCPELQEALRKAGVRCVILEDCYTLAAAESLSEYVEAVVGINGSFVEYLLSTFYARLDVNGPYYEVFSAAHWSFFNHQTETRQASAEQRPYYITRNTETVAAGHANLRSQSGGGYGIAGSLFKPKEPEKRNVRCLLHFATNRKPVDPKEPRKGFSGERDEQVHFGTCRVLVPHFHKIGSLGSPWWKDALTLTRDDRFRLDSETLSLIAEDAYWTSLRKAARTSLLGQRSSLVYIHGYNVPFELAALRAAQLAVDLKVRGAMNFFSWPSKGRFAGYTADEASIEASEREMTDYLRRLLREVGSGHVDVIAHSMGNRGLLRALPAMLARAEREAKASFGQIILAAPDIDEKLFRDLADSYRRMAKRTTLYVSSKDLALASSGIVHGHNRAGYTPPVTILPGIDTIETSSVDLSFLGHGYYADAREVLQDMFEVLRNGPSPDERFAPKPQNYNGLRYWTIAG